MFHHLQEYTFPGYTINFCSKCSVEQVVYKCSIQVKVVERGWIATRCSVLLPRLALFLPQEKVRDQLNREKS